MEGLGQIEAEQFGISDRVKRVADLAKGLLKRAVELVIEPTTYTCNTAKCRELGGVVVGIDGHYHPCPLEHDECDARDCNENGICQA